MIGGADLVGAAFFEGGSGVTDRVYQFRLIFVLEEMRVILWVTGIRYKRF